MGFVVTSEIGGRHYHIFKKNGEGAHMYVPSPNLKKNQPYLASSQLTVGSSILFTNTTRSPQSCPHTLSTPVASSALSSSAASSHVPPTSTTPPPTGEMSPPSPLSGGVMLPALTTGEGLGLPPAEEAGGGSGASTAGGGEPPLGGSGWSPGMGLWWGELFWDSCDFVGDGFSTISGDFAYEGTNSTAFTFNVEN
nr:unnamed protein product [Callosobruchus chinensis]